MPILVRGHYKDTVARYDIETLFIIIERYVKLYIFDRVEIVHVRTMGLCVIALNRDVSGRWHFIEIISHSFSILSHSVYRFYRALSITSLFLAKIAIVTHLPINLRTCVVP